MSSLPPAAGRGGGSASGGERGREGRRGRAGLRELGPKSRSLVRFRAWVAVWGPGPSLLCRQPGAVV